MQYLSHHGIKGQQWGVRNGPPYPIETGIRKGQQFSSVTIMKNGKKYLNAKPNMYVYNHNDIGFTDEATIIFDRGASLKTVNKSQKLSSVDADKAAEWLISRGLY